MSWGRGWLDGRGEVSRSHAPFYSLCEIQLLHKASKVHNSKVLRYIRLLVGILNDWTYCTVFNQTLTRTERLKVSRDGTVESLSSQKRMFSQENVTWVPSNVYLMLDNSVSNSKLS